MSFRSKTILGIALIETVLLLVLVLTGLAFLYDSNDERLQQHATTTTRLFASATRDAMLASDLATLESLVADILDSPDILYARIRDADGLTLAEGGLPALLVQARIPDKVLADVKDQVFDASAVIRVANSEFGRVELGIATRSLFETFETARAWAIGIAAAEVVLVALFSFLLGAYLTRGLSRLRDGALAVVESGPGEQLPVSGNDEIADLTRAFNTMSRALHDQQQRLRDGLHETDGMLREVQRSELMNRAVLEASLDAVVTIDQAGKVIDFNRVAEQIFGWERSEIIGQAMDEHIIPPEYRQAHQAGMHRYLASGESRVLNQRIHLKALHRDGRRIPVEIAIADIQSPDGPMFTAFIRDISRQIEDETELRLAATAFEASDAMFITDRTGTIIRVNAAFTATSGYSPEDVIGQQPRIWSSGHHDKAFYDTMWDAMLTEGGWSGEIYNQHKAGHVLCEHLNISSVRDGNGDITHFVARLIDISGHKDRENQLRLLVRQAERADEAKGRFLAVMSHEIRTPMNAVLGILDLLRESPLNTKQQRLLSIGRESGDLLLSVINDILDFSKMEAGKLALDAQPFDLHRAITQSCELLRAQAQAKNLQVILMLDPDLPKKVRGDHSRLRQVLVNLIFNAIKFTEQGTVTVKAAATGTHEGRHRLQFRVLDTGTGIAASILPKLFEPFFMIDQSHSRQSDGTGLGLSIARHLVTLMHGEITVESKIGVGSCFTFDIELDSLSPEETESLADETQQGSLRQPFHILLAEDNEANRELASAMLADENIQLDVVVDGYEALTAVRENHYDLVLMDVSMPQMDGIAATRAIRNLVGSPAEVPIVALTAHSLSGDRERFLNAGMNDYLSKPVKKTDLLRVIDRWAQTPAQARTVTTPQEPNASGKTQQRDSSQIPSEATGHEELLDEGVLQQLVKDTSPDVVPTLLRGYIDDSLTRIARLREALAGRDPETLVFEAHTLGSSAAAHGNPAFHRAARAVEKLCREGEIQRAFDDAEEMLAVADASLQALAERIEAGF